LTVKAAVRERDGYRCTDCGMTNEEHRVQYGKSLDVHRLVPGSAYTPDGCVTLCRKCHASKPKRPAGQGECSSFRPPLDIRQAVDDMAREQRRTFSQMLLLVVEAGLTRMGRMPPREE
jgi:hypothetical protein